jgi:hypothetical protein
MFAFYDTKGEILAISNDEFLLYADKLQVDSNFSVSTNYVVDGTIVAKPKLVEQENIALLAGQTLVISNVPTGTILYFEDFDTPISVEDGTIEIEFVNSGSWEVPVYPTFPYQFQVLKVTVQ